MSEFLGHMREYRQLSIDRFDGFNLKSTAFFLSHCHKDHMTGLDSPGFIDLLRSRTDIFLYCTEISKCFLLSESVYKPLEKYIKILTPEIAESISLPDVESCKSSEVLVTPLPALHCPGSVMFLFEGDEGTVLYTGDFRWETNHAVNISAFKTGDSLKEIESMYIDTTFCVESAFHFPSRMECCEVSCNIVNDWLSRSNQHYVHITSRTKYGHEPLMRALHDSTGYKIHVPEWKFDVYSQISELSDVFTTSAATRIHACNQVRDKEHGSKLPCGFVPKDGEQLKVRSIRPSTMFFTMGHQNVEPDNLYVSGRHMHRVCYSFHSSYSEIRDIVTYLKPKRIVPNVKPLPDKEMRQVQQRLNKFLQLPHRLHVLASPSTNLGKLKQRKRLKSLNKQVLTDSEELVFDSQSPMKAKQTDLSESHILKTPEKIQVDLSMDLTSPTKTDSSQVSSSYERSVFSGEEMSLNESDDQHDDVEDDDLEAEDEDTQQSLRLYVSGDDEVSEDERVSSLSFTDNCQEESIRTEEKVCNKVTSESVPAFQNKVNGMIPAKNYLENQSDISDEDEENIVKNGKNTTAVLLDIDKNHDQDENIVKNSKNSTAVLLDIDKNHDQDGTSVADLTLINENYDGNENKVKEVFATDNHAGINQKGSEDVSATNNEKLNDNENKKLNDNENSLTDVTTTDIKCDESNQNRKQPLDGNNDDDISSIDELVRKRVQRNVENAEDVSHSKNITPILQSGVCDRSQEDRIETDQTILQRSHSNTSSDDNDKTLQGSHSNTSSDDNDKNKTLQGSHCNTSSDDNNKNKTLQGSHSNTSSDDNNKNKTLQLVSSCKTENEKKALSERTNSCDLDEDHMKSNVDESQGFEPECFTIENLSGDDINSKAGDDINSKAGDSQGFNDCAVGDGDCVDTETGHSEEFQSSDVHGDGVQVKSGMLKVDSCVLTAEDGNSSLGKVQQCKRKSNESDNSSEGPSKSEEQSVGPSKSEEHLLGPSNSEEHSVGPSKPKEHSIGPSKSDEHSVGPSKSEEHSDPSKSEEHSETEISSKTENSLKPDTVSSNVSVGNKSSAEEHLHDNHLKKNSLNMQSQLNDEEQNVDLSVLLLVSSNEDSFSEKTPCSPQLLNTDNSFSKTKKRRLSVEEPHEDKNISTERDGHRHSSNSSYKSSTFDNKTPKKTSCLSKDHTSSVLQMEHDSDVVVIDLSDSDSQEPPTKRWKQSPMPNSNKFTACASSTSQNRSVLDHLDHLKTVLERERDSDSDDNTLPPSQRLLYGGGFYSDSDSEVQIISDDDDDYSQNCYSHHSEDVSSTGWHTARVGVNDMRVTSNTMSDEEECIDLTLDDD